MQFDFERARQRVEGEIRFVTNTGLRALELRPGYAKCMMPLSGNENHIATMYAGALFTLAEIAGGALFVSTFDTTRYFAVVMEMQVRFVKPADSPITLELHMDAARVAQILDELSRAGKARFELTGELKSASDVVVARSSGLYQARNIPQPVAAPAS
jgi:acyl-coenzyme A thioesterase PaaI-like protein